MDEDQPMPAGLEGLEPMKGAPVATAQGIAAIALSMALKYHDIQMVKDGALYQQYKLEGKNFRDLHLDMVFETAIQFEKHLMFANDRISSVLIDVVKEAIIEVADDPPQEDAPDLPEGDSSETSGLGK